MKKIIVKLDLNDDKNKQKAMKSVSTLHGIDSIAMDMKEKKMTVIGTVDPIDVVSKLRKTWHADIVAVGPAKEEKKDGKKDEKKDGKKEEKKEEKKDDKKKEEKKEKEKEKDAHQQMPMMHDFVYAYNRGYPHPQPQPPPPLMNNQQYFVRSMEENPNACVIS